MTVYDSLHSLPDYECLLFRCDWLGSVTSSTSVVHWLALHSWTLNFSRILRRLGYGWLSLLCTAPYIDYR
jgi:hypothetical protein